VTVENGTALGFGGGRGFAGFLLITRAGKDVRVKPRVEDGKQYLCYQSERAPLVFSPGAHPPVDQAGGLLREGLRSAGAKARGSQVSVVIRSSEMKEGNNKGEDNKRRGKRGDNTRSIKEQQQDEEA
jgi:hypothetical protein